MQLKHLIKAVVLIMVLFGCAKKTDTTDQSADGTWKGECLSLSSVFYQDTLVFNGNSLTENVSSYSDANCTQLYDTLTANYSVSFSSSSNPLPGTTQVAAKIENILDIPATTIAANNYNALSYCGLTNWSAGVSQDITGITLCSMGAAGSVLYQIYIINASINGSTASPNTMNIGENLFVTGSDFYDQATTSGYPFFLMANGYQRQ